MEQELNLRGDDSASGIDAMKTQIEEEKAAVPIKTSFENSPYLRKNFTVTMMNLT